MLLIRVIIHSQHGGGYRNRTKSTQFIRRTIRTITAVLRIRNPYIGRKLAVWTAITAQRNVRFGLCFISSVHRLTSKLTMDGTYHFDYILLFCSYQFPLFPADIV